MTKKDYELIAEAFMYGTTIPQDSNTLYWVADLLATKLEKANPRFDRTKFLQACGILTYDNCIDSDGHDWSDTPECTNCGLDYRKA